MVGLLYNIRSLHNVGSIFRTADAVGIKKLYLCGITPAPADVFGRPRQQLTKVSLGAEKYVAWEKIGSARPSTLSSGPKGSAQAISKLIDKLKKEKYKIFAIEQSKNSIPYNKLKYSKTKKLKNKIALIVGNEIKGLPKPILKKADKILEIPMYGRKESLNVVVAFGIVAFYLISAFRK
ncbi:MAG: TrmH family RNA methyltransferase [Candidatus Wolfebacteria bacterium]|nr:TrmH family RNA methyltransferase [Candidatus Wolfebacteria bacterium]